MSGCPGMIGWVATVRASAVSIKAGTRIAFVSRQKCRSSNFVIVALSRNSFVHHNHQHHHHRQHNFHHHREYHKQHHEQYLNQHDHQIRQHSFHHQKSQHHLSCHAPFWHAQYARRGGSCSATLRWSSTFNPHIVPSPSKLPSTLPPRMSPGRMPPTSYQPAQRFIPRRLRLSPTAPFGAAGNVSDNGKGSRSSNIVVERKGRDRLENSRGDGTAPDENDAQVKFFNSRWIETPHPHRVFGTLGLVSFDAAELDAAFSRLDRDRDGVIDRNELRAAVKELSTGRLSPDQQAAFAHSLWNSFSKVTRGGLIEPKREVITKEQFSQGAKALALRVDPRVWWIAATFLASGVAIGVIIPCLPQMCPVLGISSSQYGLVVGAFALSKMAGNIPSAALEAKIGRRRMLVLSTVGTAVSIGGIALIESLEGLLFCRLVSGFMVAGFLTAATTFLADISTPLNRARTMAPPTTGFSAGMALGPVLGGVLAGQVGTQGCFAVVGASFSILAVAMQLALPRLDGIAALPPSSGNQNGGDKKIVSGWGGDQRGGSVGGTQATGSKDVGVGAGDQVDVGVVGASRGGIMAGYGDVVADWRVRACLLLQMGYWFVLSGSQMTILPLVLVSNEFGLTSTEIGGVFALVSVIGTLGSQPAAWLVDRVGKPAAMLPACALVGVAMAAAPLTGSVHSFVGMVCAWTLAGTVMASAPMAYITDLVTGRRQRTKAVALLRAFGDLGMFVGALAAGVMADVLSSNVETMQLNGAVIISVVTVVATRFLLSGRFSTRGGTKKRNDN